MAVCAKATLRLKFSTEKILDTLLNALAPETRIIDTRRANVTIKKEDCFLILTAQAEDTVALRATLNAYLRWVQSTIKVIEVIKNPEI